VQGLGETLTRLRQQEHITDTAPQALHPQVQQQFWAGLRSQAERRPQHT
jgi:hypothetical protein